MAGPPSRQRTVLCAVLEQPLAAVGQAERALSSVHRAGAWPTRQRARLPAAALVREAGFARTEAYAEAKSYGTSEKVRAQCQLLADRVDQIVRARAIEQGWADAATMDAIVAEMRASAEDPDTFFGAVWCSAIGWVDP